jgi:agmatine deiminase
MNAHTIWKQGAMLALVAAPLMGGAAAQVSHYPGEDEPHEGTWLQWPHRFTYGLQYRQRIEPAWVAMTSALVSSENVHIIAYNASEVTRIQGLLSQAGVPLTKVDFLIRQTDDCWVRDNGPIFVHDAAGELKATDWGFNGWGQDAPFTLDDPVPTFVAGQLGLPVVDLNTIVLEGGAIEVDGQGTLMATRSSILEPLRNPGLTQADVEAALTQHLGVTNFVWLDGTPGGFEDITDTHIDGVARFSGQTIVTMGRSDLVYYGLTNGDVNTLYAAQNAAGDPFSFLILPLTQNDVVTTYGFNLQFKGSYVNYYAGNTVVLVPTYNDPNDSVAINLLQGIYPNRAVVGIDMRNLYRNGGMVHCVTQQQPLPLGAAPFCDDSDGSLAACPCANPGNADTGCDIQQGTGGVGLSLVAQEASPQNRVTWSGTGFPASSAPTSIVIRATSLDTGAPVIFGDGLRCIGTPLVRLAATFASGGTATHTHGHGAMAGTGDFYYQLWFRNTPVMFCDPVAAFNLSNGRIVTW